MQRNRKGLVITYAKTELVNNELVASLAHIRTPFKDEKSAVKYAEKATGTRIAPLAFTDFEQLDVVSDVIFDLFCVTREDTETDKQAQARSLAKFNEYVAELEAANLLLMKYRTKYGELDEDTDEA